MWGFLYLGTTQFLSEKINSGMLVLPKCLVLHATGKGGF
jgi:hypothetical protein